MTLHKKTPYMPKMQQYFGYFAGVKKKGAAHHGLRKDRRYKVICELLRVE